MSGHALTLSFTARAFHEMSDKPGVQAMPSNMYGGYGSHVVLGAGSYGHYGNFMQLYESRTVI